MLRTSRGLLHRTAAVVVAAACGLAFFAWADLSPDVTGEFFFASDDPQLQADRAVADLFPAQAQVIISVANDDIRSMEYGTRIHVFSLRLLEIDGVNSVKDIRHGPDDLEDAFESPLWRRLLIAENEHATNLIVGIDASEERYADLVPAIDRLIAEYDAPDFRIGVSGVPYVVHHLDERLAEDLRTFGAAALVVFTLFIAAVFRSWAIVAGALAACGTAAMATLLAAQALGMETGILTANTATIVVVFTLSHIVFLIANWWEALEEGEPRESAVGAAIRRTGTASFWAMVTSVLGFLSLYLSPARPLQEFGLATGLGALVAIVCAYTLFPPFLEAARRAPAGHRDSRRTKRPVGWRRWAPVAALVGAAVLLPGVTRLETDPPLLSYFERGGELREGLERIDRTGGSSPLELVVADERGATLARDDAYERLWALQQALERDPNVGSVISLPVIMAEADRATLSFLLSWDGLLDRLEDPKHERVALSFVTGDRRHGRFLLRMREAARDEARRSVIGRIERVTREHGFEPVLTAGLYAQQGHLARLVRSSLVQGLAGLMVLFGVVGAIVSRSARVTAAMLGTLAVVPVAILGVAGYVGIPLDIISAPAASVAIAIGVDDMLHMTSYARRHGAFDWVATRRALWRPVAASSAVVVMGFAIFLVSNLPPTQRLGFFVVLGTALAVPLVLFVFPPLAGEAGAAARARAGATGPAPRDAVRTRAQARGS